MWGPEEQPCEDNFFQHNVWICMCVMAMILAAYVLQQVTW